MLNEMDRVYSLNTASRLTGFSLGKFRYNKDKLVEVGVVVDDRGWLIPHRALVELGWLEQGAVSLPEPTELEIALFRVRELEAEVARLREADEKPRGLFGRRKK